MKKVLLIAVLLGLIASVGLLFLYQDTADMTKPAPEDAVDQLGEITDEEGSGWVLRPTIGLEIGYLDETTREDIAVFARYRLFDSSGTYQGSVGAEGNVDISAHNATVTLMSPTGMSLDLTSEKWFYPYRIYPPIKEAGYQLRITLHSGETFLFSLPDSPAQQTRLIRTKETRVETMPGELDEESTSYDWQLYEALERTERESRTLTGFVLEGVDLSNAEVAYQVNHYGVPHGGELPTFQIDDYFWLDLEEKRLLDEENRELAEKVADYAASLSAEEYEALTEKEKRSLEFSLSSQGAETHLFLARVAGKWYYASAEYPKDFE